MRNIRRHQLEQKKKARRLIFYTVGILSIIYLTASLIIGDSGLIRYMRLRSMRNKMIAEINMIRKRNEDTKARLKRQENDEALIEELAREHGLAKEGELIFKFEEDR